MIGTTANAAPDAEPNLVYAHLPSASSSGQLVRVWTVTVLSERRAQTERAAAVGVQSEYDCARNLVRPIGRATYSDRQISVRQNFAQVTSPTPNPIAQGTVAAQVHSLVCASRPNVRRQVWYHGFRPAQVAQASGADATEKSGCT